MRIKIGNLWHEATPRKPIMVELTDADKERIAGMPEGVRRYAMFHAEDRRETAEREAWMDVGTSTGFAVR